MPIVTELSNSDTLVIAVTGIGGKLGLPVVEFFEKSEMSSTSKIILIDPTKRCILGGIPPDYPSFFHLLSYLQTEIKRHFHKKLIVTGTSAGAHSALLLGHLLKASRVVAFSPYPYLSIKEAKRMKDPVLRSMARLAFALDGLPADVKKFFDLRNVLADWNRVTEYRVHVSRYNLWDFRRAMYLKGLPNLSIISHPHSVHSTVCSLARDGRLKKCFQSPYPDQTRAGNSNPCLKDQMGHYAMRLLNLLLWCFFCIAEKLKIR